MKYVEKIFIAFGTLNTITIFYNEDECQDFKKILNHIEEYINEIDNKFLVYKETSEVTKINNNAGIKYTKISQETFEILNLS